MSSEAKTFSVSQWGLGFTILIGVLLANLLTIVIIFSYLNYEARLEIEQLNKVTSDMNHQVQIERERASKKLRVQQKQQAINHERNRNAQRIRNETCNFWTQQVAKENIERNRLMKMQACSVN